MTEEMSFLVSLENGQGFSGPDGGGKFTAPARNGEWKRSGKWFCFSLWHIPLYIYQDGLLLLLVMGKCSMRKIAEYVSWEVYMQCGL